MSSFLLRLLRWQIFPWRGLREVRTMQSRTLFSVIAAFLRHKSLGSVNHEMNAIG
jgi:hypothetical protein